MLAKSSEQVFKIALLNTKKKDVLSLILMKVVLQLIHQERMAILQEELVVMALVIGMLVVVLTLLVLV
jgi:hypothetical protein